MANKVRNIIKTIKNSKMSVVALVFLIVVAIVGIKNVYAYYFNSVSEVLISAKVGDFDLGEADINMMMYKQGDDGKYTRVYSIPTSEYYCWNSNATTCTITCNSSDSENGGNCNYSYDTSNHEMTLTSDQKVTCKFYFDNINKTSDIDVLILIEDSNGAYTNSSNDNGDNKKYSLVANIPAYGYKYSEQYSCTNNDATVSYDAEEREFSVETDKKSVCYAYFEKDGSSDITVVVYVQEKKDKDAYKTVTSIPNSKTYTLNSEKSKCYDDNGESENINSEDTESNITYVDGYINITSSKKTTCNVYLDLAS